MGKRMGLLLSIILMMVAVWGCGGSNTTRDVTTVTTAELPADTIHNAIIYEVNIRNYTAEGTFDAFAEHLPRLQRLGVDILWLMPIHPISAARRIGSLGSWYAVADYRAVNPNYGTDEDFRELVEQAHEMGFLVVLDWVANHTGWDNPWITEHPDWYSQDDEGNIIIPSGTNWNDVADLNYQSEALRLEMIDCLAYWVSEFDIDGYRADYAGGVPQSFWEAARTAVDAIKPVFWLAEDDTKFGLLDEAFQANYAFSMMGLINGVAAGTREADDLRDLIDLNATRYPEATFPMYYATNHDVNAWEGSIPRLLGDAEFALSTLVFTIPGMPLIYSGQEIGSNRSLKFFDKDAITWTGWETNATHLFYEKLTVLKKANPALWHDDLDNLTYLENGDPQVLVYARTSGDNRVVVVLNLSETSRFLTLGFAGAEGTYTEYFTGETATLGTSDEFRLEPWEYRVYIQS